DSHRSERAPRIGDRIPFPRVRRSAFTADALQAAAEDIQLAVERRLRLMMNFHRHVLLARPAIARGVELEHESWGHAADAESAEDIELAVDDASVEFLFRNREWRGFRPLRDATRRRLCVRGAGDESGENHRRHDHRQPSEW